MKKIRFIDNPSEPVHFDGEKTFDPEGRLIGHGDLRKCANDLNICHVSMTMNEFIKMMNHECYEDILESMEKKNFIYYIENDENEDEEIHMFSSLDVEDDPLYGGFFAINSDEKLLDKYKKEGLNGFKNYEYCICDVFEKSISKKIVDAYLNLYKIEAKEAQEKYDSKSKEN